MTTTDQQYLMYLKAELKRKEALRDELSRQPKAAKTLLQRIKVNGAGSYFWQEGKWIRT